MKVRNQFSKPDKKPLIYFILNTEFSLSLRHNIVVPKHT
jgi:hypothetical protein